MGGHHPATLVTQHPGRAPSHNPPPPPSQASLQLLPLPPRGAGPRTQGAHSSRIDRRELVAPSPPPSPGGLPRPRLCTLARSPELTLALRDPDAWRSPWLRQGSQRQRGSGALQSTPTARSQGRSPVPVRSTRRPALPTSAAARGHPRPRPRPPPRPHGAQGPASGAGRASRGTAAAPRRPTVGVLGPPSGRRAPGVPARPPEPRALGPGTPRGRPARADGGRTAGAAPRLPRLPAEGARPGHAGESRRADASPSGAARPRRPSPHSHTHTHTQRPRRHTLHTPEEHTVHTHAPSPRLTAPSFLHSETVTCVYMPSHTCTHTHPTHP